MRALVCGGRDFNDYALLKNELDMHPITVLITGMQRGADTMAWKWAKEKEIETLEFPAKWNFFGARAGFIRNVEMVIKGKPDVVIAFPGGPGTAMMRRIAIDHHIKFVEIRVVSK